MRRKKAKTENLIKPRHNNNSCEALFSHHSLLTVMYKKLVTKNSNNKPEQSQIKKIKKEQFTKLAQQTKAKWKVSMKMGHDAGITLTNGRDTLHPNNPDLHKL